ncbi:MAG: ferritin family protein [Syntrophales bacterium]
MAIFEANEIFQFAVRIEENGEKFYRHAATITEDEEERYLFNYLADEEVKHKEIFKNLLSGMDLTSRMEIKDPPETYPGEYMQYLRNYLDGQIIFDKKTETEFSHITDTLSAVTFAIDREVDSVLYYSEIKKLVPQREHKWIDKIIDEERKHFLKLSELKKELEAAEE